jgi:hypothetical protein
LNWVDEVKGFWFVSSEIGRIGREVSVELKDFKDSGSSI